METLSCAKKWALTGGVSNHLTLGNAKRIERVYIAGYQDGSVRMWDATHPVLSLLCIFESEVRILAKISSKSDQLHLGSLKLSITYLCRTTLLL